MSTTFQPSFEKLRRVKGDDSTASRIVDRYGGYVGKSKESAKSLGKLKDKQTSLDDLAKFCDNLDADLKARIAGFVDKRDPLGIEELPKLAESLRRRVESRSSDWRRRSLPAYMVFELETRHSVATYALRQASDARIAMLDEPQRDVVRRYLRHHLDFDGPDKYIEKALRRFATDTDDPPSEVAT